MKNPHREPAAVEAGISVRITSPKLREEGMREDLADEVARRLQPVVNKILGEQTTIEQAEERAKKKDK